MKRVGIREFRDHAMGYLAGSDVLAIERHGRPIGFYVPAAASQQETIAQALQRLHETVERVRSEAGLGEEELSHLYDLNEPLPEQPRRAQRVERSKTYAPRG